LRGEQNSTQPQQKNKTNKPQNNPKQKQQKKNKPKQNNKTTKQTSPALLVTKKPNKKNDGRFMDYRRCEKTHYISKQRHSKSNSSHSFPLSNDETEEAAIQEGDSAVFE
jgi:uncharacterized membrane protein YdfJ with MMPL/SSD domain